MARTPERNSTRARRQAAFKQKLTAVGQSKPAPRTTQRRSRRVGILTVACAGALILGLVTLFVLKYPTASASDKGTIGNVPAGYGSLNHPKGPCGNAGQAPCAATDPGWFAVTSDTPAAISTAIGASSVFASMKSRAAYTALDTPALVHAFGAHTGNAYYDSDHWLVSVRNAAGLRCGLFDFVYDRANHRMRFSSFADITQQDPHARLAFPYISATTALTQLSGQRHLSIQAGAQPELIFFPIDPSYPVLNSPAHRWSGGGNSPMEPMWRMVGTNGQSYFVGTNLRVATQTDLPIAQGQP